MSNWRNFHTSRLVNQTRELCAHLRGDVRTAPPCVDCGKPVTGADTNRIVKRCAPCWERKLSPVERKQ
jgi:hypothetical protein